MASGARTGLESDAKEDFTTVDPAITPVSDNDSDPSEEEAPISSLANADRSNDTTRVSNTSYTTVIADYDSMLSAFDEFASKTKFHADTVVHEYDIGDMVWGKVKSHPWWPGQIYNESYASLPVRKSKREGCVLVAFFGDSSYGWFDPAELLPFEPNFAEKSRQTSLKSFINAVDEALDELSRRRVLGLSCRCRNQFNFWPSSVEGYLAVDVGENEPGLYSLNQINKAREFFRPNELLSFVKKLASTPMDGGQHGTIEFIKNKATALACRKARFEEFDETYAQAFGTLPARPARLTAPAAVDPSKASLSGRLVIAESQSKGEISMKPTKTKDQVEKEQYLFKRRDEPTQRKKFKKAVAGGQSGGPLLADGSKFSGKAVYSGTGDHKHQTHSQPSSGVKTSDGSKKLVDGGAKKAKLLKRPADNANPDERKKKKKKVISTETSSDCAVAVANTLEKTPKMPLDDEPKNGAAVPTSSSVVEVNKQAVQISKVDLSNALSGLRTLALDPFHATEKSSLASVRQVFLKYRSLVYQKSLVLSEPTADRDANEARPSKALASGDDVSSSKAVKHPARPNHDSTNAGKKRGPLDRPEEGKKKRKIDASDDTQKKKIPADSKKKNISEATEKKNSEGINKKKIINGSSSKAVAPAEKRQIESQQGMNSVSAKSVPAKSLKKIDHPPAKKSSHPTMLVMKFPQGATLPSVGHLKARFTRFGPMDSSAARVFWGTHTCRLVFQHRVDAEAALRFASGSRNLFGCTNVRCYLRDVESEAAAPESKEDSAIKASNSVLESSIVSQQQPKSILKKPMGEEASNSVARGARVKFVLIGEESSNNEQQQGLDSKNLPNFSNPQPPSLQSQINTNLPNFITPQPPLVQNQINTTHIPPVEEPNQLPDISQEMMSLLKQNYDIIKNLERRLGHMPYVL